MHRLNKHSIFNIFISLIFFILSSCNGGGGSTTTTSNPSSQSSSKAITVYSINGSNGIMNGQNITVTLPAGTNITNLVADFNLDGKNVEINGVPQTTGVTANNFTSPLTYTVTAENNSTIDYIVTVNVASASDNAVIAYSINNSTGIINGSDITVNLPAGTDITNLVANFSLTGVSAYIGNSLQTSGVTANDFTNPIEFTVLSQNGESQTYIVTVNVASNSDKSILSYSINNQEGVISEKNKTIIVTLPFGTNTDALVANFATNGSSVSVKGVNQVSGVTANKLSSPITYIVTAKDNTQQSYLVSVNLALAAAKSITYYNIGNGSSVLIGNSILVSLGSGTSLYKLVANFQTTGVGVTVNGVTQISGVTANNFESPVQYIVEADDKSTQTYTVTVTVSVNQIPTFNSGLVSVNLLTEKKFN